jgi:hypothetical protein
MSRLLPAGFEVLEPFAARWAGETAMERAHFRAAYPEAERDAFYTACAPLLKLGLARLDEKPLAEQDEVEQRLMRLLLTFAHVSLAVELQGPDEHKHARLRVSMRIVRATADC